MRGLYAGPLARPSVVRRSPLPAMQADGGPTIRAMGPDDSEEQRTEHRESHEEAALAVGVVIALQLTLGIVSLAHDWKLAGIHGWVWFIPVVLEVALVVTLVARVRRIPAEQSGGRRRLVLAVLAVIAVFNGIALVALLYTLVAGHVNSGGQLLLEAATVWATNIMAFGLAYWEFDRGGPVRRVMPDPPPPDFQFPQMENPELAAPGWRPRLFDYIYVSFTNATAFSPTDAMPLSRQAKALMLTESSMSAVTILLVAARAVNILS